jgi:hypothetical protein
MKDLLDFVEKLDKKYDLKNPIINGLCKDCVYESDRICNYWTNKLHEQISEFESYLPTGIFVHNYPVVYKYRVDGCEKFKKNDELNEPRGE